MTIQRNTAYNVAGALAPIVLTIVTVPLYLEAIGEARYGLLALLWLLLGYFGLFDLGLSTATAAAIAKGRGTGEVDISRIFLTSLVTNACLGLAVAAAILFLAPLLIELWSKAPPDFNSELLGTIPWLAGSIPLVTVGGVFLGVLTAHERFLAVNVVGIVGTTSFQLVPLIAAYWLGPELEIVLPAAVLARALPVLLYGIAALRQLPIRHARPDFAILRGLLAFGGWVMISNLIGPILVSANQFVVAGLLGATAVAHYNIAYSLVSRLTILPTALMQSLFPRLSQIGGEEARALAEQACRLIMTVMSILCAPAILLARPFLLLWLGPEIGAHVAPTAEILLVSMWFAGTALIPFVLLQSQGRPAIIAKFHMLEAVPYFGILYLCILHFGVSGAALAWGVRIVVDAALIAYASRLRLGKSRLAVAAIAIGGAWLVAQLDGFSNWFFILLALALGLTLLLIGFRSEPQLAMFGRYLRQRIRPRTDS